MTFSITSDDGVYLGTAEDISYELSRPKFDRPDPFGRVNTVRSTPKEITLEGFHPSVRISDLELKVRTLETDRDFYRDLFNRVAEQRLDGEVLARQRGKTIAELTEKFREKKERIHAFYAPQLENRKAEQEELSTVKVQLEIETKSANDWFHTATARGEALREADLRIAKLKAENKGLQEKVRTPEPPEGRIGQLSSERDRWREAHRERSSRVLELSEEKLLLAGELAVVKAERDRLLSRINCFMDDFNGAVSQINHAVEYWNDDEEGQG